MKKIADAALTPRLRFPEFRDAEGWESKLFEELFTIGSGRDHKHLSPGNVPVYGSGGYMRSVDDYLYDGESACIGRKGTINSPMLLTGRFWAVDTLFYTHSFKECLPRFIFALFQRIDWLKHNEAGGIPSLSKSNIENIRIAIPSLAEQRKLADFLTSLDELIAVQARRVDALKAHKTGLTQQLFPREGDFQPRLRFPEFRNAGGWKVRRLSGVVDLISGTHLPPDAYSTTGEVPYFTGPSDFTNDIRNVTKWTRRTANTARAHDTLITVKGSGVGEIWYSTLAEVAMGRQLMALRAKNGSSRFMFQLLLTKRSRFEDLGSGNLIPGLSRAAILDLEACFPSPAEQKRIADCLTSLDELIVAQTQKLNTLKVHKKGLMQQLFPPPEEA